MTLEQTAKLPSKHCITLVMRAFVPHCYRHLSFMFWISHSNMCILVPCSRFHLHFPNDILCWKSFCSLLCHLSMFFGAVLYQRVHFVGISCRLGICLLIFLATSCRTKVIWVILAIKLLIIGYITSRKLI